MTEQEYKKGEILFREGTVPAGIFFIKRGKVKKYQVDRDGKEQIFYVVNSGELIGYHAILTNERYLTEFKTAGILDTHGRKIVIREVGKLIALAGYNGVP